MKESASFQVQPGHVILPFHLAPLCFTFHCKAINRICPDYYSFRGSYGIHHLSKLCNVHLKKDKILCLPKGGHLWFVLEWISPSRTVEVCFSMPDTISKEHYLGKTAAFYFCFWGNKCNHSVKRVVFYEEFFLGLCCSLLPIMLKPTPYFEKKKSAKPWLWRPWNIICYQRGGPPSRALAQSQGNPQWGLCMLWAG